MTSLRRSLLPFFASLLVSSAAFAVDLLDGAVYVMTNQPTNEIVIYDRLGNGTLQRVGQVRTGGQGDPFRPGTTTLATDPLASQGAIAIGLNSRVLFAVNAGSDEISAFAIGRTGLTLVDRVASGGTRPISLTTRGNLLYVLNEGGTPNVTAFTIANNGDLTRLSQSTRSLSSGDLGDPAQVSFTPDGARLVITGKRSNLIATLRVKSDGRTGTLIVTPSSGLTPFGFGFSRGRLIVSEAAAGASGESSVSSYAVSDGGLAVISGAVPDFGTAACWLVVTGNGRYAYTSNTGSGQVSSYRVRDDGSLRLLDATASDTSDTSLPIDMARSSDSRYLYVHLAGKRAVAVFRIQDTGALTRLQTIGGLPRGAQGIDAR
jgi:6-phosphogluconolactonase